MNELNPAKIFGLSQFAYLAKTIPESILKDQLGRELPFIDKDSVNLITATSGLFTPVSSGPGPRNKRRGRCVKSVSAMAKQAIELVGR